jgi:hypothetical protein
VGTYILEISLMWTHSLHKVCKQTSLRSSISSRVI